MKFKDIQITLQNLKPNERVTLEKIGLALGIKKASVSNRAKTNSELRIDEIKKLEDYFNVKLFVVPDGEMAYGSPYALVDKEGFDNASEIIERIGKFRNDKNIGIDEFSGKMELRPYLISQYEEPANLSLRYVQKISENFDVSLDWLINGENTLSDNEIEVDFFYDVFGSCGSGAFVLSENKTKIFLPKELIADYSKVKKYAVINAIGDSMLPTINDKDKLIVEHCEAGEQIKDNKIYVFCYEDCIYVKRLIKNIDEIIIKSDNPDPVYRVRYIQKEDMNNIALIGQIVGIFKDVR